MKILLELNADEIPRIFNMSAMDRLRRHRFQAVGDGVVQAEDMDSDSGGAVMLKCSRPEDMHMVEAMLEAFARLARESKDVE